MSPSVCWFSNDLGHGTNRSNDHQQRYVGCSTGLARQNLLRGVAIDEDSNLHVCAFAVRRLPHEKSVGNRHSLLKTAVLSAIRSPQFFV